MTAILGILNLTPDSFSDGGQFLNAEDAIVHAQTIMQAGAAAIDVGPSSSHPGMPITSSSVEIERLAPVLDVLLPKCAISVDSFHSQTQRYAISRGVAFLNDIHGFPHAEFYPELAAADCQLIVMHSVHGTQPAERIMTDPAEIMSKILRFFHARLSALTAAGIASDRLILDPGMGFFLSSEPEASLVVLQQIAHLRREFALPILISVSNKSFIQRITRKPPAKTGFGTLSAELFAAAQGVDWIRTHDVSALQDGLAVQDRLLNSISYNTGVIA